MDLDAANSEVKQVAVLNQEIANLKQQHTSEKEELK